MTVQEHGTLMSDSAAKDTPHMKRYWAAAQRKTPHNNNIGTHHHTTESPYANDRLGTLFAFEISVQLWSPL